MKIVYPPKPNTLGLAAKIYALSKEGKKNTEIAKELGRSKSYVGALLDWFLEFKGEKKESRERTS